MIDESRKDRDYLWGRIFGELSLWMDRAKKLAPTQREHMISGWDVRPLAAFTKWQEQYRLTVAEAGAPRGEEDRRIGEIMWNMTPETATDNSPLGADCWLGYQHERTAHSPKKEGQN